MATSVMQLTSWRLRETVLMHNHLTLNGSSYLHSIMSIRMTSYQMHQLTTSMALSYNTINKLRQRATMQNLNLLQ